MHIAQVANLQAPGKPENLTLYFSAICGTYLRTAHLWLSKI
jgi:hypothetical protein